MDAQAANSLTGELSLELCQPIETDARQVMAWRNDPETRKNSFHGGEKVWDSFWPEFTSRYFAIPALPPLFVRSSERRLAFIRFRACRIESVAGDCVDISVMVDPENRGQGIAGEAIRLAIDFVATHAIIAAILAEVKPENAGSKKLFVSAGFTEKGPAIHQIADTGESQEVVQFVYPLKPSRFNRGRVFIIAEAGSNWRMGTAQRDRAMGCALIDAAVEAGADAVKFQTYRAESVYVENAGSSVYLSKAGIEESIQDIFADLAMPYEMIGELAAYAKSKAIEFMSTPFSKEDFAAVDPHVAVHKIASYEISHTHLLELCGKSGKPLVLSTGASDEEDIAWAVDTFRNAGGTDLCLLQCTAKYPAPMDAMNLRTLDWLSSRFGVPAGLSDHSRDPVIAPVAAVARGARVIEKHYTLDNNLPGPDHSFAITAEELKLMVRSIRDTEASLGSGIKEVVEAERELAAYARRGLQAIRDIAKGDKFQQGTNFEILRPGQQTLGIHPKNAPLLEGQLAVRAIARGEGLQEGDWIGL